MARPITQITDTFKVLRDNLNTISNNVGDPDLLTTTTRNSQRSDPSDVVSAFNELDSDLHGAGGGDVKNNLTSLDKLLRDMNTFLFRIHQYMRC